MFLSYAVILHVAQNANIHCIFSKLTLYQRNFFDTTILKIYFQLPQLRFLLLYV